MSRRWLVALTLVLAAVSAVAGASGNDRLDDWRAVEDSLYAMPRWEQVRWLAARGLPDSRYRAFVPDSQGLTCIGRWSYGPSTFVAVQATATDTVVFLSRGSGVSIIRFRSRDGLSLTLLSDINCAALTGRLTVRDSLLFVGSGGLETYDIRDLTRPALLSRWSFVAYDYFIKDTFCYVINRDSLRVFSISDPLDPRFLGGCRDSGYAMYVSGNHAYLGHQYGLYILDVSNPALPHRVATLGFDVTSLRVRDSFCYFTTYDSTFRVYNVRNPSAPVPLGTLHGVEPGYLDTPQATDTVVYTSALDIISVSSPAAPHRIGQVLTPGWNYGCAVMPALDYALVADHWKGLEVVDIIPPSAPTIDTVMLGAATTEDISIAGDLAFVANNWGGMKVLDVTDPTAPEWIGNLDTVAPGARSCHSVAARDSFAFLDWWVVNNLLAVDVSDPSRPRAAGGCEIFNPAEDLVLRDSFLYVAEDGRFQVVNVARPREPEVVGILRLPERSRELILDDTLAYIGNLFSAIVVNVTHPAAPESVGSWAGRVNGIDLVDTVLFVVAPETLWAVNVADPRAPVTIGFVPVERYMHDVVVVDTVAYCVGWSVQAVSVADPASMRVIGEPWAPVNWVRRVLYESPYLYFCCTDGGVCIMETLQTALAEAPEAGRPRGIRVEPSVTTGRVRFWSVEGRPVRVSVYNASGAKVTATGNYSRSGEIDVSHVPGGVYLLRFETNGGSYTAKVVKTTGR